jgi:hypothetical protein
MGDLRFSNKGASTLSIAVQPTDVLLEVVDASSYPTLSGSEYFLMVLETLDVSQFEVVRVTNVTGNILDVVRGVGGTIAGTFAIGDRAENRLTKTTLEEFIQRSGDTVDGDMVWQGGMTFEDVALFQNIIRHEGSTTQYLVYDEFDNLQFELKSTATETVFRARDDRDVRHITDDGVGRIFIEDIEYPRDAELTDNAPLTIVGGKIVSAIIPDEGGDLPPGGDEFDILIKQSSIDYDADWVSTLDGGYF